MSNEDDGSIGFNYTNEAVIDTLEMVERLKKWKNGQWQGAFVI